MLHWLGSQQASRQAGRSSRTRRAPSSWVVLMAIEAPTRGTLLRSKRRTSRVCIIWPRSWDWWGHRKQRLVSRCSLEYIFCCCHSVSTALLTWAGHSITTWTWFHPFGTTYLPTSTWAIIDVFWPPTLFIVSTWFLNDPLLCSAWGIEWRWGFDHQQSWINKAACYCCCCSPYLLCILLILDRV